MPATKVEQFGGMLPAWDDRLLPANQASLSQNAYLYGGALIGWRKPKLLHTLVNSAAKMAFRIPTISSSVANAYLIFVNTPNNGDTVTIGEIVYTWKTVLATSFDVLIGGSATNAANNLLDALTGGGTAGTNYGLGTETNSAVDQTGLCTTGTHNFGAGNVPYLFVQAPSFGAAFNTTAVAESTGNARTTWLFDLVSLTDLTATFTGGTNQTADTSITGASAWLEFLDPDTDVMRTPVPQDTFMRYYWASPSQPPQYNTYSRIVAGNSGANAPFLLGVPAPGCAPTVTTSGGGPAGIIGLETTAAGAITVTPNVPYAIPVTISGAQTLSDITVIPQYTLPSANYQAMLFTDNNGAPGDLIAASAIVTGAVANQPLVMVFSSTPALLDLVPYWLSIWCDTTTNFNKANTGAATGVTGGNTFSFSGGAPNSFPLPVTTGQPNMELYGDTVNSAVTESRVYVYTWVTAYGEEGPPSPTTSLDGFSNATWNIGLYQPPADDLGTLRNITEVNIYRSITGSSGATTYFFVAQVAVGTATYADTISDSVVAVNAQLQSSLWFPPPTDLQGIKPMPNGMTVGFRSNELWFSEPFRPHAWPPSYVITTEFPIVGIGVTGQSVVACTQKHPEISTGVAPSTMASTKIMINEPCLSRGAIIGNDAGVFYPSPNGLVQIQSSNGGSNITEAWITRDRWRSLTPQKNLRAIRLCSDYFCLGTTNGADVSVAQEGYTVELGPDAQSFTIWPQAGGHKLGFGELTSFNGFNYDNIMLDVWSGTGLILQNNGVYYIDFSDPSPAFVPFKWRSKKYQQHYKHDFSACKVIFDIPVGTPTQNVPRDTNDPQPVFPNTPGQYGILRLYADDNLWTTREIRTSSEVLRIKSGAKYTTWQVEIEGIVNIKNVIFATSVKELAQV